MPEETSHQHQQKLGAKQSKFDHRVPRIIILFLVTAKALPESCMGQIRPISMLLSREGNLTRFPHP